MHAVCLDPVCPDPVCPDQCVWTISVRTPSDPVYSDPVCPDQSVWTLSVWTMSVWTLFVWTLSVWTNPFKGVHLLRPSTVSLSAYQCVYQSLYV